MKEFKLHRKDSLIITTIDIIDDLGIQGLSTREIAKREGISEATLFRHFKNKNDLLIAVLDYFARFDEDLFQSVMMKKLNSYGSVQYLIRTTVEYYENYPAVTSITQLFDVFRYDKNLTYKVNDILHNRLSFIKKIVDDAKANGELLEDVNPDDLVDLIFGIVMETCLRWRINGRSFSLTEKTMSALDLILHAYFKK